MDSLSQVVLGSAVFHTVAGKKLGRSALILGGIVGTLPDLDILIHFGDAVKNYTYHRSFSHSLFVLTLLSPVLTLLLWPFKGLKKAGFKRLLLAVWLTLITHPLLDGFTVYGTQMFWPLPRVPESWSSLFIIDPLYTLPLLVMVMWALIKPHRIQLSVIGLVLSTAYIGWSIHAKQKVEQHVRQELIKQNIAFYKIKTVPTRFNTIKWRGIVMSKDYYYETVANVLKPDTPLQLTPYRHNQHWVTDMQNNRAVQRLAWFTNGFYRVSDEQGLLVMNDLRMGSEGFSIFRFAVAELADVHKPFIPKAMPSGF